MSDFIIKNGQKWMDIDSNMDLCKGFGVMVNNPESKYYEKEFIVSGKKFNGRNGWDGDSCFTFKDTTVTMPINENFLLWYGYCDEAK